MVDREATDGRRRAVIEAIAPAVDAGRFPVKRVVGERIVVEADIFADGHDLLGAVVQYRAETQTGWTEAPMQPLASDRWHGEFVVDTVGRYFYTVVAWVDHFRSWRHDLARRTQTEDISAALLIGADLIEAAAKRAADQDARRLQSWADALRAPGEAHRKQQPALDEELASLMARNPDRRFASRYAPELSAMVDRARAAFGAWYELFPRSCASEPGRHGSFRECEARLPYVAAMGFDVLYLPPIHPIGRTKRKGKNNTLVPESADPGSPWAIGGTEGGHKSVHPELGTLADFRRFAEKAQAAGLEIALDIAFQCSPDHPYVDAHPEWFLHRPDGTVQYAENPPKRYEDIYPFHFESEAWEPLWDELKSVVRFWIDQGVRIFRVDNPQTKPFPFWEGVIGEIKRD